MLCLQQNLSRYVLDILVWFNKQIIINIIFKKQNNNDLPIVNNMETCSSSFKKCVLYGLYCTVCGYTLHMSCGVPRNKSR